MAGNLKKAADARIQKANITWRHVIRKIFRYKAFNRKIRITLWNSLIRSTTICGLHTKDLPRRMLGKWKYTFPQHTNHDKHEQEDRSMVPGKPNLQKTAAVGDGSMAQQNANHDNDDADAGRPNDTPKRLKGMITPRAKLQKHWGVRNQSILEHATA